MKISIILPTYNEKDNIITLIKAIKKVVKGLSYSYEIIVVDDNSPDKTGKIVKDNFTDREQVKVYIKTKDRGLASSIHYGITKSKGDIVIVMDTDFSHDPDLIPVMLKKIKKCDMVIGSRYAHSGGGENKKRYWMSKMCNLYLKYLLRIDVSDFLFGYFCVKRSFLDKNNLVDRNIFSGFGDYFMKLVYYTSRSGGTFIEIPAYYKNRIHGSSKSNLMKMFVTYTNISLSLFIHDFKKPWEK